MLVLLGLAERVCERRTRFLILVPDSIIVLLSACVWSRSMEKSMGDG